MLLTIVRSVVLQVSLMHTYLVEEFFGDSIKQQWLSL